MRERVTVKQPARFYLDEISVSTGYLGDIGVPRDPNPMDFSAWFEAYLGGRWYTFDPRNNVPRIGRVLMAIGRDASEMSVSPAQNRSNPPPVPDVATVTFTSGASSRYSVAAAERALARVHAMRPRQRPAPCSRKSSSATCSPRP